MTTDHHDEHERSPVQDIYDELGGDFERVARAESRSRARSFLRRRLVLLPAAVLVLGAGAAGAIAATSGGDDDHHKVVPFSNSEGTIVFETEVPVLCEAEAQWWDELVEREGGSLPLKGGEPFVSVPPEMIRENLCEDGGPTPAIPAPAPLFGGPGSLYPDCPVEVQESVLELDSLSRYTETPGYPVPGCPTLEELEEHPGFLAEFERRNGE